MDQPEPTNVPDYFPEDPPKFFIGQRVCHVRYGYRGLIVDFDMSCHADDDWYHANPAPPDRQQPWYHVLVHGSAENAYVAQENLAADRVDDAIVHPLIDRYFTGGASGVYERNDRVWPSW